MIVVHRNNLTLLLSVVDTWGRGGISPPILWRTMIFCSREMGDVMSSY